MKRRDAAALSVCPPPWTLGSRYTMDRTPTRGCVATREAAMIAVAKKLAARMTQHNRVMIWGRLSNSRQAAYSAAIIGRGFARAPMAERPVALPPEIREPMRHATFIPTSTAAVREVRHQDCRNPRIRGGSTGFRGSMPRVRAFRYVLA